MTVTNEITQELSRIKDAIEELKQRGLDKDGKFYVGKLLDADQAKFSELQAQQRVLEPLAFRAAQEESIQGFLARKKAQLLLADAEIEEFELELAQMQAKRTQLARFVEQIEQEVKA